MRTIEVIESAQRFEFGELQNREIILAPGGQIICGGDPSPENRNLQHKARAEVSGGNRPSGWPDVAWDDRRNRHA